MQWRATKMRKGLEHVLSDEWESSLSFFFEKSRSGRCLVEVYKYLIKDGWGKDDRPRSSLWNPVIGKDIMDANWNTGKQNERNGGETLEEVAQRGCRISVLGQGWKPRGHSPEQPAPGDCFEQGSWTNGLQRCLTTPTLLWFCDEVRPDLGPGEIHRWKGWE